jgi:NAD(P)-dependent dehydrogenase (short-subunit alcohol dehydrogenase family)
MGNRLENKVAIVTGGGGGIGAATAQLFWEEGGAVVVLDNDAEAAGAAARAIDPGGERVLAIAADLTHEAEAERAVRETVARFGRLDVLANVAGVRVTPSPVTEATAENWRFVLNVNLLAAAYTAKFAVPEMVKAGGGSVVNVSSANAIVGRKNWALYDASKAALLALTRDMACDHAEQRIRVNAVLPGPTLTSYHIRNRARREGIGEAEAEARMRAAGAGNLMKRQGEPRELAYAILFLSCDESSYVTGAVFVVDGGLSVAAGW